MSANYSTNTGLNRSLRTITTLAKPLVFHLFSSLLLLIILFCAAAAQSGGQFDMRQSVIAGGGASSSGGQFAVSATIGQPVAGQKNNGAQFFLHAGFWNPAQFVPTAATVTLSGRVVTLNGSGIRNCLMTLTNSGGQTRTAVTAARGYFYFTEVEVGNTYVLTVSARKYRFAAPSQVLTVNDELGEITVTAQN
jgi:hypothetical protein